MYILLRQSSNIVCVYSTKIKSHKQQSVHIKHTVPLRHRPRGRGRGTESTAFKRRWRRRRGLKKVDHMNGTTAIFTRAHVSRIRSSGFWRRNLMNEKQEGMKKGN
ncbi:HTH-type transcriptional regulator MlrA [Striga asiatica]|uniref:HTH-type transcriptional regulator MlrA n=1 Tax=Striga asiatica TaxID=4170 RepID=A0A5A7PZ27_STRAF|nr:HTH-type transcriptional regulator MlrA [Striga asiatica]